MFSIIFLNLNLSCVVQMLTGFLKKHLYQSCIDKNSREHQYNFFTIKPSNSQHLCLDGLYYFVEQACPD